MLTAPAARQPGRSGCKQRLQVHHSAPLSANTRIRRRRRRFHRRRRSSAEALELQIPPDCGNGYENAGVSLARLLYHVPIPAMVTLMASLLLERRVVIVGQSRDTVSAAVCAANALLYPFK